jgi:hypothetical protein
MPYAVGAGLALSVSLFATSVGFDRDRAFYPTVTIVKLDLWIVVGALGAYGVFDVLHPHLIANPGVPTWWPGFCLTYDVTAAGYLALRLGRSGIAAKKP